MAAGETQRAWWASPALQAAATVALLLLTTARLLRNLYQLTADGISCLAGFFALMAVLWLAFALGRRRLPVSGPAESWLPGLAILAGFAGLALITVAQTRPGMLLLAAAGLGYGAALFLSCRDTARGGA